MRRNLVFFGGLALMACGKGTPVDLPDLAPPSTLELTSRPNPVNSRNPSPAPTRFRPTPPATGSILLGTVGSSDLDNQLVDPQGLAFGGGSLFVADANRNGLLGAHGAVIRFDPDTSARQGVYEARTSSESLPVDVKAVAVSTTVVGIREVATFVYPLTGWGVFGFVGDRLMPLNNGLPFAPGGRDIAIANSRAWIADENGLWAYHLPDWLPDPSAPNLVYREVKGIGIDQDGTPWVAADHRVFRADSQFQASGSVALDPRDVAVGADGQVYVLDSDRVLRYGLDNAFQGWFGVGVLRDATSLVIGDDGSVYVCDHASKRVFRFAPP